MQVTRKTAAQPLFWNLSCWTSYPVEFLFISLEMHLSIWQYWELGATLHGSTLPGLACFSGSGSFFFGVVSFFLQRAGIGAQGLLPPTPYWCSDRQLDRSYNVHGPSYALVSFE